MTIDKIERIRAEMPVTRTSTYLNTGTAGPLSTHVIEILQRESQIELENGRSSMPDYARFVEAKHELRQAFANLVHATPDTIALTHHTTDGMNIVSHGLNLQAGDEVVTTTLEHEGGLLPLYMLKTRKGVTVSTVDLMDTVEDEEIVAKFESAITPRTRLLVFSHVAWNTGQRLPMTKIVAMAHRHHVLTLVDAAQSVGAIALNLPASGVDFYAMPGQKWLCGIEGTGALYVRRDRLSQLSPTFVGYSSMEDSSMFDYDGAFMLAAGARRFEVGTVYRPAIHAMLANLRRLDGDIGWGWITERIAKLAEYAYKSLKSLPGVTVITPKAGQSGLITFTLADYDPARVTTKLGQENITIRFLPHPYALRVSTGFYNTTADIDRFIGALESVLSTDPNDLPEFVKP